jgi:hypothetical protein
VLYKNYTQLKNPFESFYYSALSGYSFPTEITVNDVYLACNVSGLFNAKVQQDIWLGLRADYFTDFYALQYFRYVALNFGLGGILRYVSPNNQINGDVY